MDARPLRDAGVFGGSRFQVAGLALVVVLYGALAWGYASVTPPWNNPDEPAHFNYIAHVATTKTLPVLQPGDWDGDQLERLKSTKFRGGESIEAIRYESWQPPLYYVAAAAVYMLVGDAPLAMRITVLRMFDIVLGATTLALSYLIARRVFWSTTKGKWLALATPGIVAGVPMFTAVSAAITNDALANLMGGLLALLLLQLVQTGPDKRKVLILGLVLGIGLLTKLTLAVFVPLAVLSLAWSWWTRDRMDVARAASSVKAAAHLREASGGFRMVLALLLIGAGLVWLPWLIRQGMTYGWDDLLASRRHDAVVIGQPRFPGLSGEYAERWLTTTFHSFWAQFGWMGIPVGEQYYRVWGGVVLLAVLGLAFGLWRFWSQPDKSGQSARWAAMGTWLTVVAIPLGVMAELLYYNLSFEQAQGRYLFPALAPLAVLLARGWSYLLPNIVRGPVTLAAALVLIGINGYVLARVLAPSFSS